MGAPDALLRRVCIAALLQIAAAGSAWPQEPTDFDSARARILGTFRSDADRTMAYYGAVGRSLTEKERQSLADMFGQMVHVITPNTFSSRMGPQSQALVMRYRIRSFTLSTVTLTMQYGGDMTLYLTDDGYFIKSRGNEYSAPIIEYFKRVGR